MEIAKLVKETREDLGLSQDFVASIVGVTQATWSKYESGKVNMPSDILISLNKVFKSPRFRSEYAFRSKLEFFNIPLLNNVDDSTSVILDSLIEEATELINACRTIKKRTKNKRIREDIDDWEEVLECEEQIADIIPALKLHFIDMSERYGLDVEALEKRMEQKLKSKKYVIKKSRYRCNCNSSTE